MQTNIFSQSIYSVSIKNDAIIGALSLGIGICPFFINNEPENIPGVLNKNEVNSFDRLFVASYKKPLDLISDYYITIALASLPVISIIPNIKNSNTLLTYGIMYAESLLLTYGTVFSLKNAINRFRPYMYTSGIPNGKENDYHNSFPSSATAFSFLGATFLSTTFSREFPNSKWKFPIAIGGYTLAAGVGAMRIMAGSHFLTDVFVGTAIGSLYGWLIPRLHLETDTKKYAIVPTGNGVIISVKL